MMNQTFVRKIHPLWLEFWSRSPATIAVETSILLLIGLIAIGGNLLVIFSIYRNPSLRTITNYFVLSLAVSDILLTVLVLPPSLYWSILSRYTFELQSLCDYQTITSGALSCISVLMIILMAVNRFVRVCRPQKYKKVFNKTTSCAMISVVWIASFVVMISTIKSGDDFFSTDFVSTQIRCGLVYRGLSVIKTTAMNTGFALILIIPVTIITYCYYKVFKKIRQHKRSVAPASNPNSLGTSVREIKVTWTTFAVLIGYCLTWVPIIGLTLATSICSYLSCVLPRQAQMVASYTAISSSAINPIIYGAMNSAFRQEYIKILRCKTTTP